MSVTVLVVDDDPQIRDLVRKYLANAGYTVLTAASGDEVSHVLGSHSGGVDLLLTDVYMPTHSGPEVSDRIAGVGWAPKVLFMSGDADVDKRGVLGSGASFIAKPFSREELLTRVRELLARR